MKKTVLLSMLGAALLTVSCSKTVTEANYAVIPLPTEITLDSAKGFTLNAHTVIAYPEGDSAMERNAQFLADYLHQLTGNSLKLTTQAPENNVIDLRLGYYHNNPEAYMILVDENRIVIDGIKPAGVFYGIQTLRKSIPQAGHQDVVFPAAQIIDEPKFAYRGGMLDVSRHFFPVDSVKTFIDMLALHNMNRFHWHLTEDQGWRIEIKSRPLLTEKASMRPGTVIGHNSGVYDSIPHGGYYTQDEIRDIVRYAADRYITIIPEIDMPGHMLGALSAYPELGCTGGPYEIWQQWGVSEDVLCAGNDSVLNFLDDVFGELIELFPSQYIHLGGDECPKIRWKDCPKCQARIAELGLKADEHGTTEEKLQSFLIKHVNNFLQEHGRNAIGWDETLEGGAADGATIMSWRGESGGLAAARLGHDVIMTPNTHFYFDYYQSADRDNEPDAIGGYLPIQKVYSYNPVPTALTPDEANHIIGIQANLWTEYIPTFYQAQYMVLPRYAALSEIQWNGNDRTPYEEFIVRVPQLINQYRANGYNYATHVFDVDATLEADAESHAVRTTLSTVGDAPIHYTLDGSEPTAKSPLYEEPLLIDTTAIIKAVAIRPEGTSRTFTDSVRFSKATTHPVELLTTPHPSWVGTGATALVDGKIGAGRYNTGGWMGFNGNDIIAVVDLESVQEISEVSVNACVETGDWIFDVLSMTVETSTDGKDYVKVASEEYPVPDKHVSGIFPHTLTFPITAARYVRITMPTLKQMPSWHNGAGKPAFAFVDEIMIN